MEQNLRGWTQIVQRRAKAPAEDEPGQSELETPPQPLSAVVQQGDSLEGRLVVDRSVRVDGDFRGSIVSPESVYVSESGTVEGDICARSVEIRGAVVGSVAGSRDVLLRAGGKLHGDVETASFVIERGAYFNGNTTMRRPQFTSRGVAEPLTL